MCSSFPGLLIGRTAVHSGKDPAFVAYDQFLSTGILQPLSRGEVRCGSKSVVWPRRLRCPLCPKADRGGASYGYTLANAPDVAARRTVARRASRERQRARKAAKLAAERGEAA